MTDATPYPLDFDALDKGSVITQDEIEEAVGLKADENYKAFRLATLGLYIQIERELRRRGLNVTLAQRGESIHILTDAQASEANQVRFARGLVGLARHHRRMGGVDMEELTDAQRAAHERNVLFQGMYITAIGGARKELSAQARKEIKGPS